MRILSVFLCFVGVTLAAVAKNSRVVEQKALSDEEPGSKEYDHEAFLGDEQSKAFDKLSPDESKRRLGILVDRLDMNKDDKVDVGELQHWIRITQKRYIEEDAKKQIENGDENNDGIMGWDEYYSTTYGHLSEEDMKEDEDTYGYSYKKMIERDQSRWKAADENGDNSLTMEEFEAFLHPEDFPRMKEVVLSETIVDIDKNGDGLINLEEYIGDMYNEEDGAEPDWVKVEREQFATHRDTDKDGSLNRDEVREWIYPSDYDPIEAEAKHLLYECGSKDDGYLTKEKIVEHHDVFVGSQITNWGEDLKRHDEF